MNNIFLVYFATRLSTIQTISQFVAYFSFTALITLVVIQWARPIINEDEKSNQNEPYSLKKYMRTFKMSFFISLFFAIFTPSTKEAIIIYSSGRALDYVESDTSLQKIPYKATEIIIKKMDDYLNDSSSAINTTQP